MGNAVGGARFLVLEDERSLGLALARIISQYGEAEVAHTVCDAMQRLLARPTWAGAVLDLRLPDGTGLTVLREMCAVCPDAEAMVLTAYPIKADVDAVRELGAHFASKPLVEERLRVFLHKAASKWSMRAALSSGGEEVELPPAPIAADEPAPLADRIEELRDLFALRQDARTRHAIGVVVADIMIRTAQYGTGGVKAVAAALGEELPTLYRHAAVAQAYTLTQIEALLARRGPRRRGLSWSHVVALASVEALPLRDALTEQALLDGWSVRRLTAAVMRGARTGNLPGTLP